MLSLIPLNLSTYEQRLFDLAQEVLNTTDYELYDVEYVRGSSTLRVYICDKETKNALIDDCANVDRAFTPFVESSDWILDNLTLEVSSPGVYRNLKTKEHFEQAQSEMINITFLPGRAKVYDLDKKVRGLLLEFDQDKLILQIGVSEFAISFVDIQKANLDPDIMKE